MGIPDDFATDRSSREAQALQDVLFPSNCVLRERQPSDLLLQGRHIVGNKRYCFALRFDQSQALFQAQK